MKPVITERQIDDAVSKLLLDADPKPRPRPKVPDVAKISMPSGPFDTTRKLNVAIRDWKAAKEHVDELSRFVNAAKKKFRGTETAIIDQVKTMKDQVYRLNDLIVAVKKKAQSPPYKEPFQMAVEKLEALSPKMAQEVRDYLKSLKKEREFIQVEAGVLSKLTSLIKRAWNWLKRNDDELAEIEQLVHYEV